MKIAIIGAGNVGGTLGSLWAQLGHEVVYGVRHPQDEKVRAVLDRSGEGARAALPAAAAAAAEVVVLAIPYPAIAETVPALGDLQGKIVVDAVNNVAPNLGAPSIAEEIAALAAGAQLVKAFNTMGTNVMAETTFGALHADNFICGDHAGAKATVSDLSTAIGFEVVDVGPLSNAGLLEGLARLWIDLAYRQGFGRDIAFRLLRR